MNIRTRFSISADGYVIGIGILVEVLRRLGIAFITVRAREKSSGHPGGARGSA